MDVRVEQATLEDRERIERFLQIAYGDRAQYMFPERWSWEYVNNPFWDGDRLPIWVAEVHGKIVGQVIRMAVPLKLEDKVYQAGWGGDLVVLPEFRRLGIGRLLLKAAVEHHDCYLSLNQAPFTSKALKSLGCEPIDTVVQLQKTLFFEAGDALDAMNRRLGNENTLLRACRRLQLEKVITLVRNLKIRLRDLVRLRIRESDLMIESVEFFGGEIDRLWEQLASDFPAIVVRNAEYLNWKFGEQPHMQYEKFVVRRAGTECGYVIARVGRPPEPKVGIIADILAAPDDDAVVHALLVHATKHLRRAGVKTIMTATSLPDYVTRFLQLGFREAGRETALFRCVGAAESSPEKRQGSWFLSMGDSDYDQYPLFVTEVPSNG